MSENSSNASEGVDRGSSEATKTTKHSPKTHAVWYWLQAHDSYIVWATGLSLGDAEALAREMRQRRPRNSFSVEMES